MANYHVVLHSEGWAVRKAGASKGRVYSTQSEAEARAKKTVKTQGGELFIHNRHGRIRERNSYGRDPYPPKG